jgi:nitroimidazol reductase NimA-like FMN-containing flavoprotein (pyridoxamine 5'-phosphate oxidase superfamily)
MLFAHIGDLIYVHGSRGSRALRVLGAGAPACLTITVVDGLVLARSAFEHSANYASLMILGSFEMVRDPHEKQLALEAVIERLVPGRWSEVRAPNAKELRATTVLSIGLAEVSVKLRSGPPDDDNSADAERMTWAGVLPVDTHWGAPVPSPGLRVGVPLAKSIEGLAAAPSAVTTRCPLIGDEPQLAADSQERRAALLLPAEPEA